MVEYALKYKVGRLIGIWHDNASQEWWGCTEGVQATQGAQAQGDQGQASGRGCTTGQGRGVQVPLEERGD
eukprot:11669199-Ditylum_brightwellii.AAC.1